MRMVDFRVVMGVVLASLAGCGPTYTRGSQDPSIDSNAMSTGLDRVDMQKMLSENLDDLRTKPIMDRWRQGGGKTRVAIFPFINGTSRHIEPQLEAILSEAETWLVNASVVTVISRERQNQIVADIEGTHSPVFNQDKVPQYGRQMGAQFYLTGKVGGTEERTDGQRRMQYTFSLQVIELETGAIAWQHTSYVSKLAER